MCMAWPFLSLSACVDRRWWGQSAVEMATLRNTQMGKMPSGGVEKKKVLF
jgi:hypothetical protein